MTAALATLWGAENYGHVVFRQSGLLFRRTGQNSATYDRRVRSECGRLRSRGDGGWRAGPAGPDPAIRAGLHGDGARGMRILLWHVHSSWTTAFVQGPHTYLVPTLPERGPDGRGRARTRCWPASVREISPARARGTDFDLMVLQRPSELEHLAEAWTGRRPGRDVPAVYVEHNTPDVPVSAAWHPAVAEAGVVIAHVSPFQPAVLAQRLQPYRRHRARHCGPRLPL